MGSGCAVKKREGRWVLCSGAEVILDFESYDEAIETIRGALTAMGRCKREEPSQERRALRLESEHKSRRSGLL
jgi:hypothetical protein